MPTSCADVRGSARGAWDQRKPTVVLQLLTPWVPPLYCEAQERLAGLSSSGDTSSACRAARPGGGDCSRQNAPTKMLRVLSTGGVFAPRGQPPAAGLAVGEAAKP